MDQLKAVPYVDVTGDLAQARPGDRRRRHACRSRWTSGCRPRRHDGAARRRAGVARDSCASCGRRRARSRPDRGRRSAGGTAGRRRRSSTSCARTSACACLSARIALLTRDDASFQADLRRRRRWVGSISTHARSRCRRCSATLKQLAATPMAAEMPDLTRSLEALRVLRPPRERARGRAPARAPARTRCDRARSVLVPAARRRRGRRRAAVQAHRRLRAVRRAALPRRAVAESFIVLRWSLAFVGGLRADPAAVAHSRDCRRRCATCPQATAGRSAPATKQDAAVVALLEGRYGKARQFAEEALAIPHSSGLAGADRRARGARDARLRGRAAIARAPDAQAASLAVPRLMLDAEMKLERGARARRWRRCRARRTRRARTPRRCDSSCARCRAAGRHAEIPRAGRSARQAQGLRPRSRASCCAPARMRKRCSGSRTTPAGLRAYWSKVADARPACIPKVARAAARSFLALGGDREAAEILAREPRARLGPGARPALRRMPHAPTRRGSSRPAERWLTTHNQDAALLYALGRPVRARAALGQGADVSRGEPRARRRLARPRRAGRAARDASAGTTRRMRISPRRSSSRWPSSSRPSRDPRNRRSARLSRSRCPDFGLGGVGEAVGEEFLRRQTARVGERRRARRRSSPAPPHA